MTEPVRGGYRPPAKPAPASGPGRLARRTDGQPLVQLPDAAYGEQKTFQDAQRSAPMAKTQGVPEQGSMGGLDMSRVVPLNAPSQYPDEPVTAGVNAGAGPGMEALAGADQSLENLVEMLPALEVYANSPNSTPFFRSFVRMIRAKS